MVKIKVKYSFYTGTLNCPKSGFIRDDSTDEIINFSNLKRAKKYIDDNFDVHFMLIRGKNTYCWKGGYILNYGEYSRPQCTFVTCK